MGVIGLVRANLTIDPLRLAVMGALSGIASASVLASINSAASAVEAGKPTTSLLFFFLGAVLVYIVSQRYVLLAAIREIEQIVHAIRLRIFEKVIHSDLAIVERIGHANIYSAAAKETQTISQTVNVLVMGAQSAVLLAGALFTSLVFMVMFRKNKQILANLRGGMTEEAGVFAILGSALSGFKEVKMNSARAAGLLEDFRERSAGAVSGKIAIRSLMADSATLSQVLVFFLVGAMVFTVPALFPSAAPSVIKTATAVLFMIGPLQGLVNAVPLYNMANAAAANIEEIEAALGAEAAPPTPSTIRPFAGFSRLSIQGLRFRYAETKDGKPFEVGPIDLELVAGQTVFLTGGNGSGKTTLMQLIVGLHRPLAGRIRVDGRIVDEVSLQAYRNLFAVVFSDGHLFQRLYGLGEPDPAMIDRWLGRLEIGDKTGVVDGAFSTLDLSAGQRKRIALLVALLEDRPIVVLDEWAADQDPEFRRKFYRELLGELKLIGKTVIAITHDDRYFDSADRHLRMDDGRLVADTNQVAGSDRSEA
ncbi:MAG: cyclic peptide export ABC transporter [Alphaproteobacteria bacterium]|nr:cyclic peptide export ABC transporter [Alphaproteobacteria bacterium]